MVNNKEVLPNLQRRNITYYLSKMPHNNSGDCFAAMNFSLEVLPVPGKFKLQIA